MTQKIDPFIGMNWDWENGEGDWGDGMNENLIQTSFLFNRRVNDIVSFLPSSPSNGEAYFLTSDKSVYYRAEGRWYNSLLPAGFEIIHKTTGDYYKFDGTNLINIGVPSERIANINDIIVADGNDAQFSAVKMLGKVFFVKPSSTIVLTVPTHATDLSTALNLISRWVIPVTSIVQIVLPVGTFASSTIVIRHPYGARISILGAPALTKTATSSGTVVGSSGAWSIPLTLDNVTDISINDYILVRNVTGTGRFKTFSGLCKVTNISGLNINVLHKSKKATWPVAAINSAEITVLKTILTFNSSDGFQVDGVLGNLDRLAIVGTKTAGTIGLIGQRGQSGFKGKAYIHTGAAVGITSFGDGGVYAQYGGTVDARYLCVSDCNVYNILAQHGGSIDFNDGISSGCDGSGIAATSSGDVSSERAITIGNNTGVYAIQGGSVLTVSMYCADNVSEGVFASWGGSVRGQFMDIQFNNVGIVASGGFAVIPSSTISNNSGAGIYIEGGGNVVATGSSTNNNVTMGVYVDAGVLNSPNHIATGNGINGLAATNGGSILTDGASLSGNVVNAISASNGGVVRATNASTSGGVCFTGSGGLIDLTGATGTPVLSIAPSGNVINTAGVFVSGLSRISKDSTYNSELTAGSIIQSTTDPLKMVVSGYDNTRDYAYIQSLRSTAGYKPLVLNPNAGNVGIGLVAATPTARLHLPAGASASGNAPLKLTAGTNLSVVENGSLEFDGTNLFFTVGGVRKTVTLT